MEKIILNNGLTIITKKKNTASVAIEVLFKVGSNYEDKKINGISHFIEHMLFEGTKTRNARQIANEIESIGGEINAFTGNDRTCYYVYVLKKHFDKALNILADIIQNPLFDKNAIEKEKKVILDEINMTKDDPKYYQFVLFLKTLFKKHPTKNPIAGSKKSISSLTRKAILEFYKKYYIPNNMVISVVGNVDNIEKKVAKAFNKLKKTKLAKKRKINEPKQKQEVNITKRRIFQSYMVLGYKVPSRLHKDSYVLDVIKSIIGRGLSSKLFQELRIKRGLAYILGINYETSTDYGYFSIYIGTDKKNIKKIIKIILSILNNLTKISDRELKDAKGYLEGSYTLENEDNKKMADTLAFWEMINNAYLAEDYLNKIKKITKKDISMVTKKYLNKNYTLAIIEQV